VLDALEARDYQVCGLDISRRSLEKLDRRGRHLIEADLTRCEPSEGESFDAILLLDVLEHLDDEKVVRRTLCRLLKPGGLAVVSVPARPDLFSESDKIQGHRRRYLPDSLQSAFRDTGLKMQRMMRGGSWMVPSLALQRNGARPCRVNRWT
jgi:2-polyprenyl-3-methyl-5-hydroxy-6-metoxy-1,4-benzoquinol methylase